MKEETYGTEQAARFFRVSVATIRKWARLGIIPGAQIGRLWRFRREALEELFLNFRDKNGR